MKVLFVYKYLTTGGVESVLRVRLDELPRFKVKAEAWFLSYVDGRSIFKLGDSRIHIGDIDALREHLLSHWYDAVSSIDTEEIFPLLQNSSYKRKVIVESHSPYIENLEYLRTLDNSLIKVIFVPSLHQASMVRERICDRISIRVVPNAIAPGFTKEIIPFSPAPRQPIIAWVGRLDKLKNWRAFIKLTSLLSSWKNDLEYWVVGRPAHRDLVSAFFLEARKAKVLDRLRWWKNLPHDRMPFLFDAIRTSGGVVVSTSKGESFGMVIAEAMARSCGVVAPQQGPFDEFILHGQSGLLYPPNSMTAARLDVQNLIEDVSARESYGAIGREMILQRHTPQVAINVLAETLHEIF